MTASVGRIENLRPAGAGRFAAEYVPPADAHPQVAIVSARSGNRWGWTAIPLSGRGMAVARSAPGAAIQVTIGNAVFGPVRADRAGNATVPVVVPAGVAYAYHGDERLELNVPATLHVHVALARAAATADVEQVVPFRVFAVTAAGAPRSGAPVVARVLQGDVGEIVEVGPGEYAGTWRLPPGLAAQATLSAGLADEPGRTSAAVLARPAGRPARIAVEAARRRIVAGDVEPLALRVSVADAAGNAVDAAPSLHATRGLVSAPVAAGPGAWEATLAISRARGARETLVVARAAGLEGQIAIEVIPEVVPDAPRERRVFVAPKGGVVAGRGGVWAPAIGARRFRTGLLDGRLALSLEAGAFVRDRTDEVTFGAQRLDVRGRVLYVPVIASNPDRAGRRSTSARVGVGRRGRRARDVRGVRAVPVRDALGGGRRTGSSGRRRVGAPHRPCDPVRRGGGRLAGRPGIRRAPRLADRPWSLARVPL